MYMYNEVKETSTFKWLYLYLKPHKFWLFVNIITSLISVVVNISIIYFLSKATDNGLNNNYSLFINDVYCLLGLTALGVVVTYIVKYSSFRCSIYSVRDMRNNVVSNLQKTSISYIDSINTGDVITTLNNDINIVDKTLNKAADFVCQPVILITAIIYLCTISWKLLIAMAVSIPIAMYINTIVSKKLSAIVKAQQDYTGEANSIFYDSTNIGGVYTSKTYNLEKWLAGRYQNSLKKALKENLKLNKFCNIYLLYIELAQVVIPIFICSLFGGYLAVKGEITTGELVACQTLVVYLYNPSRQILRLNSSLKSTSGAIVRISNILNAPKELFGTKDLSKSKVCIEFDEVSFSYDEQKNILNKVSFKVHEGEKIALVGESGSGKSTIFKLLCGFYKKQLGDIKVYGDYLESLDINKVRENISIVSQDVYIFPGTIYSNIKNGSKSAKKEDVIAAAKLANIHDYIIGLPKGYETIIGENGVNLSGGQKQRLSIARAILKNSPVLLLDEATSALDTENEAKIQNNLNEVFKDKTIVTIAHNLSTIMDSDKILVLNKGVIVEKGTHKALMEKGEYYKELYNKQFKV